ncbi:MAG: IS1 transposase [Armatimonadetes bacterium]|nr:IS1 transposase [Anaerolineae bacterium]
MTRCIVGFAVVWERSTEALQTLLDHSVWATHYYSDAFTLYRSGVYAGTHHGLPDKSQTYSVEADNAQLRHYLARLGRQSRCFSRSIEALHEAIQLFVYAWNKRQLYKRAYPRYPAHCAILYLF